MWSAQPGLIFCISSLSEVLQLEPAAVKGEEVKKDTSNPAQDLKQEAYHHTTQEAPGSVSYPEEEMSDQEENEESRIQ